jgi:hypothetical protein
MGRACSTHDIEIHAGFLWERKKERDHYEYLDVGNINIDLREIELDGVDCIDLAQDRDQWRALVNTVMNLRVP